MGADREGLEARRMPGRPHQSLPGHHQKFPGNKELSAVQPSWTIMCAMLATSYWMFLVLDESVTCRQSPKSDAKSQNAKKNPVELRAIDIRLICNPSGAASLHGNAKVACILSTVA